MATFKPSYNSRIKKDSVVIAGVKSGTFSSSRGTIDINALGDLSTKILPGMKSYTLSLTVMMDTTSTEQDELYDAFQNGTKLTDMTVYYDSTAYIEVDTDTDSDAGMYVTKWDLDNFTPEDQVIQGSVEITGSGPFKKSTD